MQSDNFTPGSKPLDYSSAGVDIDAGNRLVTNLKPIAAATQRPEVLSGLGGFGALFELPLARFSQPVLVAGTDGVGTKLILAKQTGRHETIGIDLVAMCVNDVIVQGAEPLFFLDYYATGKLDVATATEVIRGIGEGCKMAGTALVGGETAEMPGMYRQGEYDLAGFCVGIVEKNRIVDGSKIGATDSLIGIASSGPHANGYSLIRKILALSNTSLTADFEGRTLAETLLEPTRIYVKPVLNLLQKIDVHGLCHITGGGLVENLPRILPNNIRATIRANGWVRQPIFDWLQETGGIQDSEMYRTFNCGIGMVVIVANSDLETTLDTLSAMGETVYVIGSLEPFNPDKPDRSNHPATPGSERIIISG